MPGLALYVPHGEGETTGSFCSRLAARNGVSTAAFCSDMDITFRDVIRGQPTALERLAELGHVDVANLSAGAMPMPSERSRIFVASEEFLPRDIRRQDIAVCPECLREDMGRWPRSGRAAPYGRGAWMIEHMQTCVKHETALVVVKSFDGTTLLTDLCDFAGHVGSRLMSLLTGKPVPRKPNPLERYLNKRLWKSTDGEPNWLDDMPSYVVTQTSLAVGSVHVRGIERPIMGMERDEARTVAPVGFDILREDPARFGAWLRILGERAVVKTGHAQGYHLFGAFYRWLQNTVSNPDYAAIRSVTVQQILDLIPVAAGKEVLGVRIDKRRLHSVRSVAQESGMHPKLARKMLVQAGFLDEQASRDATDDRALIRSNESLEVLIDRARNIVGSQNAIKAVGLGKEPFMAIVKAGFIEPFVLPSESIKSLAFSSKDVQAFIERLGSAVTMGKTPMDTDVGDIIIAARMANRPVVDVVRLILEGKLKRVLRRSADVHDGRDIYVSPMEVRALLHTEAKSGLSIREATHLTHWSAQVVEALARENLIEMRIVPNPINGFRQRIVSEGSIESFHGRFIHVNDVARVWRTNIVTALGWLQRQGVEPAFDRDRVQASFFERAALQGIPPPDR